MVPVAVGICTWQWFGFDLSSQCMAWDLFLFSCIYSFMDYGTVIRPVWRLTRGLYLSERCCAAFEILVCAGAIPSTSSCKWMLGRTLGIQWAEVLWHPYSLGSAWTPDGKVLELVKWGRCILCFPHYCCPLPKRKVINSATFLASVKVPWLMKYSEHWSRRPLQCVGLPSHFSGSAMLVWTGLAVVGEWRSHCGMAAARHKKHFSI